MCMDITCRTCSLAIECVLLHYMTSYITCMGISSVDVFMYDVFSHVVCVDMFYVDVNYMCWYMIVREHIL